MRFEAENVAHSLVRAASRLSRRMVYGRCCLCAGLVRRTQRLVTMNRRQFLATGAAGFPAIIRAHGAAADRMNVLWILGDDLGVELGCYGYRGVHTPNIDRLAHEGTRFTQFHTTAPVCSASRSAFNVGLYQTKTGTNNHRSHRQDG